MRASTLMSLLGVIVGASPAPAVADDRASLAHFERVEPSAVTTATTYALTGVAGYTHVLFGSYTAAGSEHGALVLLRCQRRCRGTRVSITGGPASLLGLVDLREPGPLGADRLASGSIAVLAGPTAHLRWPVLLIERRSDHVEVAETIANREVTGTNRRHDLLVVSLRRADARAPVLAALSTMALSAAGAGTITTYRLERGAARGALDIVGQDAIQTDADSGCLPPQPPAQRWVLAQGRYQRVGDPGAVHRGCH